MCCTYHTPSWQTCCSLTQTAHSLLCVHAYHFNNTTTHALHRTSTFKCDVGWIWTGLRQSGHWASFFNSILGLLLCTQVLTFRNWHKCTIISCLLFYVCVFSLSAAGISTDGKLCSRLVFTSRIFFSPFIPVLPREREITWHLNRMIIVILLFHFFFFFPLLSFGLCLSLFLPYDLLYSTVPLNIYELKLILSQNSMISIFCFPSCLIFQNVFALLSVFFFTTFFRRFSSL